MSDANHKSKELPGTASAGQMLAGATVVSGLITTKLSAASTDGKAGQESTKIQLVFFYCLLQAGLVLI